MGAFCFLLLTGTPVPLLVLIPFGGFRVSGKLVCGSTTWMLQISDDGFSRARLRRDGRTWTVLQGAAEVEIHIVCVLHVVF